MHIPFESPLKAMEGPDILPVQSAWSHMAASNTFGTVRTPPLTPNQTCRLWFRQSTPRRKLCSRFPKLPSPFCVAKSQASGPRHWVAELLIAKCPEVGSFVDISIAPITSFEEGGAQRSRDDSARVVVNPSLICLTRYFERNNIKHLSARCSGPSSPAQNPHQITLWSGVRQLPSVPLKFLEIS